MRIAVLGHVEHITLGTVPTLPAAGDIVHLHEPRVFPGGGGGITFFQLLQSDADVVLYTAIGNDDAGGFIARELAATRAEVHAARREEPHTRDLVVITPDGERTIYVIGEPLHPRRTDPLAWDRLGACDGAYFTAQDPEVLKAARAARVLVVTARRREAILKSGVRADVIVGSANDPREASRRDDYPVKPRALVMTEGGRGGYVETDEGVVRFSAPAAPAGITGAYGAGDSFAGALAYYAALGLPIAEAAARAAAYGAAVLGHAVPIGHQKWLEDA